MSAAINDGSIPYGSQVLTINAVTYVAESITLSEPTNVIERMNELGEPSGQVLVNQFNTGSATLQLASTSTAHPANGMTFTADLQKAGSNQTYIVSEVSPQLGQQAAKTVNISFRQKIN